MATATFRQGANSYSSAFDTMLLQSTPSTIYGAATTIGVDSGSGAEQQALLRFDNLFGTEAQGRVPVGATITSATLTLFTTNSSAQGGTLHRMRTGWDNSSTWNSLIGGVQIDGTDAVAAADVVTGATASGSRAFDVTASVRAWAGGAANRGWVFDAASSDGWDFASSEAATVANRPLLSVTYTTGAGLSITQSGGSTSVSEAGATDSFTVALTRAPTANVTVSFASNPDIAAIAALTFTPANWNVEQTATVRAVNDSLVEGTEAVSLRLSAASTDSAYSGVAGTVPVTVIDNDGSGPPAISFSVVKTTSTNQYRDASGSFGIGDPSGIAYVPGRGLFIADSEHDESPYNSQTNLWLIRPDNSSTPYSLRGFTKEPTGLAYNPTNGYLYITDDDARKVFWVDPAKPATKVGEFSVGGLGITDAEDPKIDPATGHIFMLDGVSTQLFELTSTGQRVRTIDLPSAIDDAEGLAYAPNYDVFFVSSGADRGTIFEIDGDGHLLDTFTNLDASTFNNPAYGSRPYLKGLELALSSNPNDGDRLSLYAVDYGKDQQADGRLFEISLGSGWTASGAGVGGAATLVAQAMGFEPATLALEDGLLLTPGQAVA